MSTAVKAPLGGVDPFSPTGGTGSVACVDWDQCQYYRDFVDYRFNEAGHEHLTSLVHPLTPCRHGAGCSAHTRLADGGDRFDDVCHHTVYTHGRPSREVWSGSSPLAGVDGSVPGKEGGWTIGLQLQSDQLLSDADCLDAKGLELVREELRAHGLEHEMRMVSTVVPRLRRHPRLAKSRTSSLQWQEVSSGNSDSYNQHMHSVWKREITDVELLALLLYTGTNAQGQIRKALRTGSEREGELKAWEWTIAAIRVASIKLAERPPQTLYHGLNGVQPPVDLDYSSAVYNNFISTSESLNIARIFCLGEGGTVNKPSSGGTVIHFTTDANWLERGRFVCADLRWLSKFPDEQEWLIVPICHMAAINYVTADYRVVEKIEVSPSGGEINHIKGDWSSYA